MGSTAERERKEERAPSTAPAERAGGTDPDNGSDESALVCEARSNPDAFDILYRRHLPPIYRYLRARSIDDHAAADLTQQVFLRAYEALPRYQERGLPFAAWLFRIARNAAVDQRRKEHPALDWDGLPEALRGADEEADPEVGALRRDEMDRLSHLLKRLSAEQRELLALRFAGELTYREIAAVVGKREGTVKKQIHRLLQSLKEQFADE